MTHQFFIFFCFNNCLLTEQNAIVSYLNAEAEKFDALIAKAQQSKELLQERRTALISAAVTGKIDVRDWQAAV